MRRNVIVVGASAGGVEALRTLIGGLPADLPASVLVVLHIPASGGSVLPSILNRCGPLPARHATDQEPIRPGTIFVAPPDHHLVVADDHARITHGPRENGHRPAIDVLFRSAARALGEQVIGVVLSGVLDDGTAGLNAIKARGGVCIAQDPAEALYSGMPESAIAHVDIDHILAAEQIAKLLPRLCEEKITSSGRPPSQLMEIEAEVAMMNNVAMSRPDRPGQPSGFSCPDCNGVLFEIRDGELVRYRCRVGHAWSAESLLGEQAGQLEGALWMALRGLEEKAALSRTMSARARGRGNETTAQRYDEQGREAAHAAALIRSMLEAHVGSGEEPDELQPGA